MTSGHFDETDLNSFYYQDLTLEDARAILMDQDQGVFLVRHSTRANGGYVVCLKEEGDVTQYPVQEGTGSDTVRLFIREECPFKDLPSLLSFYKRNLFKSTALIRPVNRDRVLLHQLRNEPVGERRTLMPDVAAAAYLPTSTTHQRNSAPPNMVGPRPTSGCRTNEDGPPVFAKVIKAKTPSAYESSALTLKIGDIVRVTRRKDGQGMGDLISTGKRGYFPLTHVELIEHSPELLESPDS